MCGVMSQVKSKYTVLKFVCFLQLSSNFCLVQYSHLTGWGGGGYFWYSSIAPAHSLYLQFLPKVLEHLHYIYSGVSRKNSSPQEMVIFYCLEYENPRTSHENPRTSHENPQNYGRVPRTFRRHCRHQCSWQFQ